MDEWTLKEQRPQEVQVSTLPPMKTLREIERQGIQQALQAAGGNKNRAARILGISRYTLYRKIKNLGLDGK